MKNKKNKPSFYDIVGLDLRPAKVEDKTEEPEAVVRVIIVSALIIGVSSLLLWFLIDFLPPWAAWTTSSIPPF